MVSKGLFGGDGGLNPTGGGFNQVCLTSSYTDCVTDSL